MRYDGHNAPPHSSVAVPRLKEGLRQEGAALSVCAESPAALRQLTSTCHHCHHEVPPCAADNTQALSKSRKNKYPPTHALQHATTAMEQLKTTKIVQMVFFRLAGQAGACFWARRLRTNQNTKRVSMEAHWKNGHLFVIRRLQ